MGATTIGALILLLCSGLFFGSGLLSACLAWWKGYRPWFWLISLGPIGALLMLFWPNLNRAATPEERERWEQRADWTGGILSGFALFFGMALPILGLALFSMSSMAIAPPPTVIAVPAPLIVDELDEMPVTEPRVSPVESAPVAESNQSSEPPVKPANEQPRVP